MGTRINYEIGSPAAVILFSNSIHPIQDPEQIFKSLVAQYKGQPTALTRALLAETYATDCGRGKHRAGDPIFNVDLEPGDRDFVLIAAIDDGTVSKRRDHPASSEVVSPVLRPRIMPGSVIQFDDEQVIVLSDEGGETLLVDDGGVAKDWHWEIDGDSCQVIKEYQPDEADVVVHCLHRKPYKGYRCMEFRNGHAHFGGLDGQRVDAKVRVENGSERWQIELWATVRAEIERRARLQSAVEAQDAKRKSA